MIKKIFSSIDVKLYPSIIDVVSFVIIFTLSSIISALITTIFIKETSISIPVSYILTFLIAVFSVLFYRKKRTKHKDSLFPRINFGFFLPAKLLWGILLMFSMTFIIEPLTMQFQTSIDELNKTISMMGRSAVWLTVLAAPLLEEILFRGILLDDIRKSRGIISSIIVSALIFGAIHFNMSQFISAAALGIVFGYIYVLTGSLLSVIILHFINNSIALTIMKLFPQQSSVSFYELLNSESLYYTLYIISVVFVAIMIFSIIKLSKKNDKLDTNLK